MNNLYGKLCASTEKPLGRASAADFSSNDSIWTKLCLFARSTARSHWFRSTHVSTAFMTSGVGGAAPVPPAP